MILILPLILILEGAIQKIYFFLSLTIAKATPIDKQVGRAAGTIITTILKLSSTKL